MRDVAVLFLHLLATIARLVGPGGARSVVAESVFPINFLQSLRVQHDRVGESLDSIFQPSLRWNEPRQNPCRSREPSNLLDGHTRSRARLY